MEHKVRERRSLCNVAKSAASTFWGFSPIEKQQLYNAWLSTRNGKTPSIVNFSDLNVSKDIFVPLHNFEILNNNSRKILGLYN
jgi:hypothetical protein